MARDGMDHDGSICLLIRLIAASIVEAPEWGPMMQRECRGRAGCIVPDNRRYVCRQRP
jgi:hypothetical protein